MTVPTLNDPFMFFADIAADIWQLNGFNPSSVSVREQRVREQADRTLQQLAENFTEKDFFPDVGAEPVFAVLTQLPDWPESIQLRIVDERDEVLASYLKGNDASLVKGHVSLIHKMDGDYSGATTDSVDGDKSEQLFGLILRQLPPGSSLGLGGDFHGSSSTAGRIVTLREQIAALAKSERARLFDALIADVSWTKSGAAISSPNPFLPFWRSQPLHYSPIESLLLALAPEMSIGRIHTLLEQSPLSQAQELEFIEQGTLPESFVEALNLMMDEWALNRAIDGVLHTRTYNVDSDVLAREVAEGLLKTRLDRELKIIEADESGSELDDPDDTHIVLRHNGEGAYSVQEVLDSGVPEFGTSTDSFYRAIGSQLQPHERSQLGMQSDTDVAGFRATMGEVIIADNGGWFDPAHPLVVNNQDLPDWMRDASNTDKSGWNDAVQDYSEALLDAQALGLLEISQYGDPEQIRRYTRTQLELRLTVELGLSLDPDQVFVETTVSEWTGSVEAPPAGNLRGAGDFEYTTTRRSLTQLCLENIGIEDLDYWITARFVDSSGNRIRGLDKSYVHGLVRELNIGDSYPQFLKQRLLSSEYGQWARDRYAQVMRAQMSIDAIEAKMAGDFLSSGNLLPENADRGYKWVKAVLDHPEDDGGRPLVEGHPVQVHQLRINGKALDGVLIFRPTSKGSVPGLVLYTPHVSDGIRFHELSSFDEVQSRLSDNPQYLAALEILGNITPDYSVISGSPGWGYSPIDLVFNTQPVTANFYHVSYEYEVRRVLAGVDAQTTSTFEANLNSAWNIACKVADIVIEFSPFKVRLPIAAARSLYALSQGVREAGTDGSKSIMHLVQAALLLADGLPGVKRPKIKTPEVFLDRAMGLTKVPEGLILRTDGVYKGVYEHRIPGSFSNFYADDAGTWFSIRYHDKLRCWQVADSRLLGATSRSAVRFNRDGRLVHFPPAAGGGRDKVPRAAKANRDRDRSPDSSSNDSFSSDSSGGKKLYTLDMEGFFEGREFQKAQKNIQEDLESAINKAVSKYTMEGKGHLHPSEAGLFSLDLPGIGGSRKRGAWRLMFERPKDGVLKCHSVRDPH